MMYPCSKWVRTSAARGDTADFAGACGDVLEGAPAAGKQSEPAVPEAGQGTLDGIAGAAIEIEFLPAGRLFDWDEDAGAGALVAARR